MPRAHPQTYRDGNPFSGTVSTNCHEACCERQLPPRLIPRALASEPERLDTCHLITSGAEIEASAMLRDAQSFAAPLAAMQPPTIGPHEPRGPGGVRTAPTAEPEDAVDSV